ncbi:hypothetical protein DFH09DRAFT_1318651 [Mycena vulgaris]|nr:hypothetical protein DFH09DRAFT_1318651 [Mycena vulgaris]
MVKNNRKSTGKKAAKPKVRFSKGPAPGSKRGGGGGSDPTRAVLVHLLQIRTSRPSTAPAADSLPAAEAVGNGAPTTGDAAAADADDKADDGPPAKKRVRNPLGICPTEVAPEAKPTQKAFQRVIRALCGMITQYDILPSAVEVHNLLEQAAQRSEVNIDKRVNYDLLNPALLPAPKVPLIKLCEHMKTTKANHLAIAKELLAVCSVRCEGLFENVKEVNAANAIREHIEILTD